LNEISCGTSLRSLAGRRGIKARIASTTIPALNKIATNARITKFDAIRIMICGKSWFIVVDQSSEPIMKSMERGDFNVD
jgi:hypothetical protein